MKSIKLIALTRKKVVTIDFWFLSIALVRMQYKKVYV